MLTASGTSFCPGMDMAALAELGQGPGVAERRRPMTHLRSMRKLTVAAINGGCAGIGLALALACDVRFAAEEAKISCAFPGGGHPPNTARPGCSPGSSASPTRPTCC